MAKIICPSCAHELTEYTRFCPQCGARLPEPEAPSAPTPAAPPDGGQQPADEAPPAAVPPTVRLDAPAAPTVVLPPAGPPPAETPTARLDEPAQPPGETPTVIGGPPAGPGPVTPLPPVAPPQPAAEQPAYGVPQAGVPYPAAPQVPGAAPQQASGGSGTRKTLMWALVGGAGCLSLVLVAICAIGVLTLLGERVEPGVGAAATITSVPSGAAGSVPEDSPLTGGAVLLRDDFENPARSSLDESDDDSTRYAFEDGAYVIEVKETETIAWAPVRGEYDDVRVEVDAEIVAGSSASAGIIFHYQDQDNFYLFNVAGDGFYSLDLWQDNELIVLIDWTESDALTAAVNRLRVETRGDRIALYVNDELLEETSDGTFTSGGVALAASSQQERPAEVRFDNLLIERNE